MVCQLGDVSVTFLLVSGGHGPSEAILKTELVPHPCLLCACFWKSKERGRNCKRIEHYHNHSAERSTNPWEAADKERGLFFWESNTTLMNSKVGLTDLNILKQQKHCKVPPFGVLEVETFASVVDLLRKRRAPHLDTVFCGNVLNYRKSDLKLTGSKKIWMQ